MQPLQKTVWRFLKKIKIELPCDPEIPLLGSKENKNTKLKWYMHPNVQSSIIYNSQDTEATKHPPADEWIKKMWYIYNRILLSHKKEWNNTIWSNMNGPRDYHTKWSKSETERQIPHDITYIWNLKYDTNELIYKTEIDSQTSKN